MRTALFDLGAPAYDLLTAQPLWREQIAAVTRFRAGRPPPRRVLDLGCGPGVSAFVLAERLGPEVEVVGVDISGAMIARAEAHLARRPELAGRVRFLTADATQLPFSSGHFDLAVGHSFLYLVPDRPGVLLEARRLLAPGGQLVLMEPAAAGSLSAAARALPALGATLLQAPSVSARFGLSMALWRLVSGAAGRLSPAEGERLFHAAGFEGFSAHPTLAGLGLHLVGEVGAPEPAA